MKINQLIFALVLLLICCAPEPPKDISIYLIGDSTMAIKKEDRRPETGWGEMMQQFFNDNAQIKNYAVNGRSSKSFIDEGRWQAVYDSLKPGDYVFIQFGHNDQKYKDSTRYTNPTTIYKQNLIRYISESREKGANPVLLTSIARRKYNEYGVFIDSHGLYPTVTREVAKEYNVPLIDLHLLSEQLILSKGEINSKSLYLILEPGKYENYPEGKEDNTHLNPYGATEVAKLVVDEIIRQDLALKSYLISKDQK
jgi:lysophospholipase L1-like esterase